ncbi:MAG: dTDP-4-dehydrorhamnose 3,5-epimerase [Novosphingobium sp.]
MIPKLIRPRRFGDARGWFSETYNTRTFAELGIDDVFVQDNHSLSVARGTLRGLHCQLAPHAQAKLVRCLSGAIYDVAVDLRRDSPSFGQWVGTTLSAEGGEQLYVPVGFAHGFMTLTDNVEVHYKCTDYYAPECEAGVIWNDPAVGIDWPLDGIEPVLSDKDQILPALGDFAGHFAYNGTPLAPLEP